MKVHGSWTICVGLGHIGMLTEHRTKVNGRTTNSMGKDSINSPMAHSMRVIGRIISSMALDFTSMFRVGNGRGSFEMDDFNQKCRSNWLRRGKLL